MDRNYWRTSGDVKISEVNFTLSEHSNYYTRETLPLAVAFAIKDYSFDPTSKIACDRKCCRFYDDAFFADWNDDYAETIIIRAKGWYVTFDVGVNGKIHATMYKTAYGNLLEKLSLKIAALLEDDWKITKKFNNDWNFAARIKDEQERFEYVVKRCVEELISNVVTA